MRTRGQRPHFDVELRCYGEGAHWQRVQAEFTDKGLCFGSSSCLPEQVGHEPLPFPLLGAFCKSGHEVAREFALLGRQLLKVAENLISLRDDGGWVVGPTHE